MRLRSAMTVGVAAIYVAMCVAFAVPLAVALPSVLAFAGTTVAAFVIFIVVRWVDDRTSESAPAVYSCPRCGYRVPAELADSSHVCPICSWDSDPVPPALQDWWKSEDFGACERQLDERALAPIVSGVRNPGWMEPLVANIQVRRRHAGSGDWSGGSASVAHLAATPAHAPSGLVAGETARGVANIGELAAKLQQRRRVSGWKETHPRPRPKVACGAVWRTWSRNYPTVTLLLVAAFIGLAELLLLSFLVPLLE